MSKKDKSKCRVCKKQIKTMCFVGTGVCGEECRKIRDGELTVVRASVHAPDPIIRINSKEIR